MASFCKAPNVVISLKKDKNVKKQETPTNTESQIPPAMPKEEPNVNLPRYNFQKTIGSIIKRSTQYFTKRT
jgi:hypothetical protein